MIPADVLDVLFDARLVNEAHPHYTGNPSPRRPPTHKSVWKHWREVVGTPNEKTCFLCEYEAVGNVCRAHILPRCYGGGDEHDNLLLLCDVCHRTTELFTLAHWEVLFEKRGWR